MRSDLVSLSLNWLLVSLLLLWILAPIVNTHSVLVDHIGQSELELAARSGIIKYLSSSSSGHLIAIGLKRSEVYLIRDGEKTLVSGEEFRPNRHSATLSETELSAIPSGCSEFYHIWY
jgi:hypothetical protein